MFRVTARNNSTRLRRIWVRLHGTSSGAEIRVGGCNAVDGSKDKQNVELLLAGALRVTEPPFGWQKSGFNEMHKKKESDHGLYK